MVSLKLVLSQEAAKDQKLMLSQKPSELEVPMPDNAQKEEIGTSR